MMGAPMGDVGESHRPVLLHETIELLDAEKGGLFIDATLGLGGHSEAILLASPNNSVLGIDTDSDAIAIARKRLEGFGSRFRAVHANFKEIASVGAGLEPIDGILVDLGVSSLQFDSETRGFSFRFDAPLDMRMDASAESESETAAQLLARLPEDEIARLIYEYGEERNSRKIARWIVQRREEGAPVERTEDLAALVARAAGGKRSSRIHPATRTFQALRIAVNHELEGLDEFIVTAVGMLPQGGRFAAISFHSLEDRLTKQTLRRLGGQCVCPPRMPTCICGARKIVEILTRRPVTPSEDELETNPRSRSAKLRVCRKLISK